MGMFCLPILFLMLVLCSCRQSCMPFGLRMGFGEIFHGQKSNQKLVVSFNTDRQCSRSYVSLTTRNQVHKVYCLTDIIKIMNNASKAKTDGKQKNIPDSYTTVVHHCSIKQIQFQQLFSYNAYGWDGKSQVVPYSDQKISTSIISPYNIQTNRKFIFLADWAKIYTKNYTSLQISFKKLLTGQSNIGGVIINGDIGYDLDSNGCQNYQDYLDLSSQIAKYWPFVYVTGNHQYNTQNNHQLYVKSFILHNLQTKLVTKINLGSFLYIAYDPYQAIYKNTNNIRRDLSPLGQLIDTFKAQLESSKDSNKPIIVGSHYPVSCSSKKSVQCTKDRIFLEPFFNLLFDYKVGFYIGAHYHSYERNYPYLRNKTVIKQQPPYSPQENNYLVNIVEGVAGNDEKIVQKYQEVPDFTAFYTQNVTGFGVLSSNQNVFNYKHYSTQNTITLKDEFNVTLYAPAKFTCSHQLQISDE